MKMSKITSGHAENRKLEYTEIPILHRVKKLQPHPTELILIYEEELQRAAGADLCEIILININC
jgi:hypothetical protein